jgi:hypothetical protein
MASSGGVRIIESDSRFRSELTGSKGTLIIANFKASWLVYFVLNFEISLHVNFVKLELVV